MSVGKPQGVTFPLPSVPLSEAITSDMKNRPVSVFDAAKVRLVVIVENDGHASISCNVSKHDAATWLLKVAKILEREYRAEHG